MAKESKISDMYTTDKNEDDNVSFELPAPPGWKKLFTPRKMASALRNDVLFVSPSGEEIKSKRGLGQYLKSHPSEPPVSCFDWGTGDTPRRSTRISEKQKSVEAHEAEKPAKKAKLSAPKKRKQQQPLSPDHKNEQNLRDDHPVHIPEVEEETVPDDNSHPVQECKITGEESGPAGAEAVDEPTPMVIEEQGQETKPEVQPEEKERPEVAVEKQSADGSTRDFDPQQKLFPEPEPEPEVAGEQQPADWSTRDSDPQPELFPEPLPEAAGEQQSADGSTPDSDPQPELDPEPEPEPEVAGEQQPADGSTPDSDPQPEPEPEPEHEPAVVGQEKRVGCESGGAEDDAVAVVGGSVENGLKQGGGEEKVSPGIGASQSTGCAANGQEAGSECLDNYGAGALHQV